MKNLNKMSEDHFLKIFFTCFSLIVWGVARLCRKSK